MKLLITPNGGGLNFSAMRGALVPACADNQIDFGVGAEDAVECPGCGRTLPTYSMHLDHIVPRTIYTVGLLQPGTNIALRSSAHPYGSPNNYVATAKGGYVQVFQLGQFSGKPTGKSAIIHSATACDIDLDNLQWLCGGCNTSKGTQSWANWNGGLTRPIGTLYIP